MKIKNVKAINISRDDAEHGDGYYVDAIMDNLASGEDSPEAVNIGFHQIEGIALTFAQKSAKEYGCKLQICY